jgi:Ternary complex associated domain 7/CHAT domain
MLLKAITLDTAMTASEVLARLARHGFWVDPMRAESRSWIEAFAQRVDLPFAEATNKLTRNGHGVGLALRRQYYANVLWYAQPLDRVLHACHAANPAAPLLDVLNLHEPDGQPPIAMPQDGSTPHREGVVFLGETPVAVSIMLAMAAQPTAELSLDLMTSAPTARAPDAVSRPRGAARGNGAAKTAVAADPVPSARVISAWPRLDAPAFVAARQPFTVVVGLAELQQQGVAGGQVQITAPAGMTTVDVSVELIADGLDAAEGWTRTLSIDVDHPTAATVSFALIGRAPAGREPYRLTTLEIRYVLGGAVCGTASRALVIGLPGDTVPPTDPGHGTPWLAQAATQSPVVLQRDALPPDLTVEIAKPNGNPGNGQFQCRLYSPHPLSVNMGPFAIDLGQDAKTFAKSIVQQIRDYHGDPLVDNLLRSLSQLVGEQLPPEVVAAMREAAAIVAPRVLAVLLVSADPYVPWELAGIEPPLDPTRPPFLGAQVALGRWIRDARGVGPAAPAAPAAIGGDTVPRPSVQPPTTIRVAHMAVMAGMYQAQSGLRRLPEAEAEATTLAQNYDAIALAATSQDVKRLLDAQLTYKFQVVGGADAIHFAGHGDFDPQVSDGSVLMLSEGKPLPSIMFRSAKYGGLQQPMFFLNACMIGVGGELLGDMGGFPGNCLKGGFGGLLGALWEVDDAVAHAFALAFWQRALPADAGAGAGKPVGEILRDLRAQYAVDTSKAPIDTYVAYVYYGHPRLTLQVAA